MQVLIVLILQYVDDNEYFYFLILLDFINKSILRWNGKVFCISDNNNCKCAAIVQWKVFGWCSKRSRRTGLLGVVKWRGMDVHWLGTWVWQGQLFLRGRREGLDQTRCCLCISDSLLAYRMNNPSAETLHCTISFANWWKVTETVF